MLVGKYNNRLVWVLAVYRNKVGQRIYDLYRHGAERDWPISWPKAFPMIADKVKKVTLTELLEKGF